MTGLESAAWGCFGAFAVEGLEFSTAIRRVGGWPWRRRNEPGPLPFLISVIIRIMVSGGLAAAAGTTGQIAGAYGALAIGVAAPLLLEQIARQIPLHASAERPVTPAGIAVADSTTRDEQRPRRPATSKQSRRAVGQQTGGDDAN